jgi:hypothetical protein
MIKQTTFGEPHGLMIPPRLRPRRIIKVSPRINKVPNQSMAFVPWRKLVRGLCTSRQKYNTPNAKPEMGRLIHQFHLQETYSVKAPPRRGPTPLARLQTTPVSPRYNPRSLKHLISHLLKGRLTAHLMLNKSLMQIFVRMIIPPAPDP